MVAIASTTAFFTLTLHKWISYPDPDENRTGLASTLYLIKNDLKARELFMIGLVSWLAWVAALAAPLTF